MEGRQESESCPQGPPCPLCSSSQPWQPRPLQSGGQPLSLASSSPSTCPVQSQSLPALRSISSPCCPPSLAVISPQASSFLARMVAQPVSLGVAPSIMLCVQAHDPHHKQSEFILPLPSISDLSLCTEQIPLPCLAWGPLVMGPPFLSLTSAFFFLPVIHCDGLNL